MHVYVCVCVYIYKYIYIYALYACIDLSESIRGDTECRISNTRVFFILAAQWPGVSPCLFLAYRSGGSEQSSLDSIASVSTCVCVCVCVC